MSLIRVLEIPLSSGNFHFSGGEPQTFVEVDWFRDDNGPDLSVPENRESLIEFIQQKQYFSPQKAYLVLHPKHSFTINYKAP